MDKSIERVERAIEAIARGEMVILVDDEDRENEGDLVMAADRVTPEAINFMATHARGLICLTMTGSRLDALQIPMMVTNNSSPFSTAFTVSIEAREGVTTGISAADRAHTIRVATDPNTRPEDLVMPGHIFPLRAREGGVLVRTGQTEGSVDLARMAGLSEAGVICEIMNVDGTMSRIPELEVFAREHELLIVSVADMINYRLRRESLIEQLDEQPFKTDYPGDWRVRVIRSRMDGSTHICLVCGQPNPETPTMVRVQHRADVFGAFVKSWGGEAVATLQGAMKMIGERGEGVVVYLDRPSQDAIGMLERYTSYKLPEGESSRLLVRDVNRPQDALRDLGIGAQILAEAGVGKMQLLTNRPRRIVGLDGYGLEIVEELPITMPEDAEHADLSF